MTMASYDSDSSSGDDANYQTTNVLLGYSSKEATDDSISTIGGEPTWLDPAVPPSAALARCKICHALMPQLLQLHADLPERFPSHERRLHLFACRRRTCARKPGSVRALRTVRQAYTEEPKSTPAPAKEPHPPSPPPPPSRDLGGAIFGGGKLFGSTGTSNSSNSVPASQTNDLPSTFAEKASITAASPATSIVKTAGSLAPPEPWPSERPKVYPKYYLDAEYEELDNTAIPQVSMAAAASASNDADADAAGPSNAAEDAEAFESILDRTFQRFADRLAQNPEQVLRYEFQGIPLLATNNDIVGKALLSASASASTSGTGMPTCPRCASPRVFEVQLVPGAIDALEEGEEAAAIEGMEWSTIIVGVCAEDCAGDVGACVHAEEWAGVQWEEVRKAN